MGNHVQCLLLIFGLLALDIVPYCYACPDGQYSWRSYCYPCPTSCMTCSNGNTCSSCNDGYYSSNGVCYNCRVSNCKHCSARYDCTTCNDGYYVDNSGCSRCESTCKTCHDTDLCASCNEGDYLDGSFKCKQCPHSVTSCDCNTGSYFDGSVCQACHQSCTTCLSATTCISCNTGYYRKGFMCEECPPSCATCSSATTCTSCTVNSRSYGQYCCPDMCASCSDNNICTKCPNGYYLYSSRCCPDACSACSSTNICTKCKAGYHRSGTQCCPTTCSACSDSKTCTTCNTGYHLTTGFQCCPAACSACNLAKQCTSCKTGYFLNEGQCTPCSDRCASCSAKDECDHCKSSFQLMSGKCYLCPNECSQCTADDTCTGCKDSRYYVDNHSCVKCPKNCLSCNSRAECTSCTKGYHGADQCLQQCSANCRDTDCEIGGRCKACVDGVHGDSCDIQCPQYCLSCHRDTGTCLSCDTCKYLDNGQCKSCPASCTQCTSSRCTTSVNGRWGDMCEKECSSCKPGTSCRKSDGYCKRCVDGKYGTGCTRSCSSKCLSCQRSSSYKCTACVPNKYGYYSSSNYYHCNTACPSNCLNATCDDKTGECSFGCMVGYHGENCKCPQNCYCNNAGQCFSCKAGFGNVNKNCECTDEHCVDADCSACKHVTHYVSGDTCCSCQGHDPHCDECTTGTNRGFGECIKCKKGFYPISGQYHCRKCSSDCKDNACDPKSGNCTSGCIARRWGSMCETACTTDCFECDQHNGSCLVCQWWKYFRNCSKNCSPSCKAFTNVQTCAIHDGACVNGCSDINMYGSHCQNSCSNNCTNSQCDWQTGDCSNGCIDNQYGNVCDKTCSQTCTPPGLGSRCYGTNGTCVDGCVDGYYGDMCSQTCSPHCVNITCDQFTGHCRHGCHGGFEGSKCTSALSQAGDMTVPIAGGIGGVILVFLIILVIGLVLIKRRRSKNTTSTHQEAVTYADIPQEGEGDALEDECPVYAVPNKQGKQANEPEAKSPTTVLALPNPQYKASAISDDVVTDSVYVNTAVRTPPRIQKPKRSKARDSSADKTVVILHDDARAYRPSTTILEETLEESKEMVPQDNETYYNVGDVMRRKVTLDKLQQYVANKTKQDFITEFQTLPVGLIKSYKISKSSENASKNRYQGIYPYDDTLVVLKGENSGYMNASYIDGYQKPRAYIASMGPAVKYMKDISPFWKMIWQENVGKIVMLTRTWEGGTNKCDQYWPDKDFTDTHADIQVTCQHELPFAEYVIRSFQVSRKSEKRVIQQIHYMAWPDKGTPDDVTSLVEFRQKVNSVRTNQDGPILVHCSAGIGRTGTYIALDILAQEGEAEQSVDILACVRNMREQRVNMVQTWDQYRYLHSTIVHTLTFDSKPIEATGFQDYMTSHSNDVLETKFQELQTTIECRSEDENNATNRNKGLTEKNRTGADIPGDLDRPRLYLGITHGASDYINAIFVNSYQNAKYFLLAQTPLPNTVSDFLALVVQEKCPLIISMDAVTGQDKDIGVYCPANNETIKAGSFTVKASSTKHHDNYTQRKLSIKYQQSSRTDQVDVTHVQFSQWPHDAQVPNKCDQFLQFIKDVNSLSEKVGTSGPVMVHCSTAAERSGLFCVVSVLLEKIECNQEVSVVNTVRQFKSKRHMAIPSQEQFIFCHECINEYLTSFDVYSNFATKT